MTDVLTDDQKSALLANVPSGRLGQGSEIAAAVVYLASPEAGYVTGATLHVNGGMACCNLQDSRSDHRAEGVRFFAEFRPEL